MLSILPAPLRFAAPIRFVTLVMFKFWSIFIPCFDTIIIKIFVFLAYIRLRMFYWSYYASPTSHFVRCRVMLVRYLTMPLTAVYGTSYVAKEIIKEKVAKAVEAFNSLDRPNPDFRVKMTLGRLMTVAGVCFAIGMSLYFMGFFTGSKTDVTKSTCATSIVMKQSDTTGYQEVAQSDKLQCVWATMLSERRYCHMNVCSKTTLPQDFDNILKRSTSFMALGTSGAGEPEFVSCHGIWLTSKILATTRHSVDAVSSNGMFTFRILERGFTTEKTITTSDVYNPPDSPEITLIRVDGIERRDMTNPSKTIFMGSGTNALMKATLTPSEFHNQMVINQEGEGALTRVYDAKVLAYDATVTNMEGEYGIARLNAPTRGGHCGVPVVGQVDENKRMVLGMHVANLPSNKKLGDVSVFIPMSSEDVNNWVEAARKHWSSHAPVCQHMIQPPVFTECNGPMLGPDHKLGNGT